MRKVRGEAVTSDQQLEIASDLLPGDTGDIQLPNFSFVTFTVLYRLAADDEVMLSLSTGEHRFVSDIFEDGGRIVRHSIVPTGNRYRDLNRCFDCGHRRDSHQPTGPSHAHADDFEAICFTDVFDPDKTCPCGGFRKPPPSPKYLPKRKEPAPMSPSKKYILPGAGGREYITRKLGGFPNDVEGLQALRKLGKHILLLGEPGCGKTALMQVAFPDAENEIGHDKLTAWDMLWRPRPLPDGTIQYDPSPLNRAATLGKPFYFDEIMRANADALTPLFSAMDGRGFIVGGNLDGTDLPVADGFCVVGASNPLVRGAFLPDAIASRFHILTVETSEDLLVRMGLDERLLVAWRNLGGMNGGEVWKPSIRELLAAQSFIDAGNDQQAAFALTGWRVPARDRETVASVISPLLGVRVGETGGVIK